ncbi:MAG TPA: Gfo/Idh/MocA family oxidoreductase [Chloroflexia bacterium]|jgi:predicted dehydrogenase
MILDDMALADTQPTNVGVIGCGNISSVYLENCTSYDQLNVLACADLVIERARAQAERFGISRAETVEQLLADPGIELVINLTVPIVHGTVGLAALRAGKSVYNEKPLALSLQEAQLMLREARERNLLVGCAPDTFLGGGLQTCRALIDEGVIGEPVAATAFMLGRGPESWHPDPEFFYKIGGGPMFDMAPYYLTALISLLGPVRRVTGSARITFRERIIGSEPKRGSRINVETPTHIAGVLDFASGPIATLVMSFDVWHAIVPRLEIYGSEGTLSLPDPNTFEGPVRVRHAGDREWREVPLTHGFTGNDRGIGVLDMAEALRLGRPHRANGELAYHVLEIMHAVHEASDQQRHIELTSTCSRPEPLSPEGTGRSPHKFSEQSQEVHFEGR